MWARQSFGPFLADRDPESTHRELKPLGAPGAGHLPPVSKRRRARLRRHVRDPPLVRKSLTTGHIEPVDRVSDPTEIFIARDDRQRSCPRPRCGSISPPGSVAPVSTHPLRMSRTGVNGRESRLYLHIKHRHADGVRDGPPSCARNPHKGCLQHFAVRHQAVGSWALASLHRLFLAPRRPWIANASLPAVFVTAFSPSSRPPSAYQGPTRCRPVRRHASGVARSIALIACP